MARYRRAKCGGFCFVVLIFATKSCERVLGCFCVWRWVMA
ncbi:hypothetical protein APHCRT_1270 [Anaplasma phagocytophilum str. CRT53-1]|uniref:Uncharacterized protein n=1 Tax=Anaplasma phagocytophilum str. CRT53-1 TaxID=1359157 RepID=A0A0F3PX78_ANAPH|nr:hypothetical protein APHCRT_1270 [Anaplasma phagocytophilum str. CRT53-1]